MGRAKCWLVAEEAAVDERTKGPSGDDGDVEDEDTAKATSAKTGVPDTNPPRDDTVSPTHHSILLCGPGERTVALSTVDRSVSPQLVTGSTSRQ